MKPSDCCHPARSIEPSAPPVRVFFHVAIVASRISRCRPGSWARSGTAANVASRPFCGSAVISSMARSVAAVNALRASRLEASVAVPVTRPGPGSAMLSSTPRTTGSIPARFSAIGSLLAKPVAASTAPCWSAAVWVYWGNSWIVTSLVVRPADCSSAWSWIQEVPYLPGMPIVLPFRSAAVLMPLAAFATTTAGKVP